ncbi:acyl carrier protein [Myceligenerans xiligouense]|uniref:Phosphopantetheine binding protein n=1 Tax=Myceligenerans xiligouense TaxID=253184 RepID=A0A3N4YGS1_9MICO|nr:acyl carrier protein [Myceligenerans xiligouense]RPF20013.1 phosphopantetheine binding protein [Myceligenerans xiligouense]
MTTHDVSKMDSTVTDDLAAAVGESWAEVLGVAPGTPGTFLSLGGHSIAANRLRSRLARLGVTVTLTDLFDDPSLEDLLHTLRGRADTATDDQDEVSR